MKACLFGLALSFALLNCASAEELSPVAKEELARLAGEWRLVGYIIDGKEMPAMNHEIFLFEKDRFGRKGQPLLRISHLNPKAQPPEMNLELSRTEAKGAIYKLQDNQLRICTTVRFCAVGATADDRPTDFETKGKKRHLMILERAPK